MKPSSPQQQRGGVALPIAATLVFVAFIAAAFAQRGVLLDIKTADNQYRAAQAVEASAAGLAWGMAQLNNDAPVDAKCHALPSGRPLHDYIDPPLRAVCRQADGAWSCACSSDGSEQLQSNDSNLRFQVDFSHDAVRGLWQLTSTGCGENAACASVKSAGSKAVSHIDAGRLTGLSHSPAAALTVRGGARFAAPGFAIHHTSAATGGLTVHAAGVVDKVSLQLVSTPGAPASLSVADQDSALAAHKPDALFASLFRLSKSAWRQQPAAGRIACDKPCGAALAAMAGGATQKQLIWLDGGLSIDQPLTLGSPQRPVALVVDGPVRLDAAVVIHGLIYTTQSSWADAAGASIHGALVAEGDLEASGATRIVYDAAVLDTLRTKTGSFASVLGSWRDF